MLTESKGFWSLLFLSCRLVQHGSYPVVGKDNSTFKDYMYIERAAVHKVGQLLCVVSRFVVIRKIYTVSNKKQEKLCIIWSLKNFRWQRTLLTSHMMPLSCLFTTLSQEVGLLQHISPTGMNKCSKRFGYFVTFSFSVIKRGKGRRMFPKVLEKRREL